MLRHRHINFQCDNEGLVAAISKGSSKDTIVMHLLRSLWFFIAHFDIAITATHLPGVMNTTADHLSRGKLKSARQSNPALSAQSTHLPPSISHIVSPQGLDWTSPEFLQLFQETLSSLQQTISALLTQQHEHVHIICIIIYVRICLHILTIPLYGTCGD